MRSNATTVDEYLAELPDERRPAIETVRALIRESAPDTVEDMQYGMACYSLGALLVSLASRRG